MLTQSVERLLPYSRARLFDLAADVERYPEFLRWWISARIRRRQTDVYYTDQVVAFGPIRVGFCSKTILSRPASIEVVSDEPPFRRFHLCWVFRSYPGGGCRVSLTTSLEFRSSLLDRLAYWVLPASIDEIILAFERRAHQLYAHDDRPVEGARPRRGPIPQALSRR